MQQNVFKKNVARDLMLNGEFFSHSFLINPNDGGTTESFYIEKHQKQFIALITFWK